MEGLLFDPYSLCTITPVCIALLCIRGFTDSATVALLTMALFFVRATVLEATRHNSPPSGINIHDRLYGCSPSLSSDV